MKKKLFLAAITGMMLFCVSFGASATVINYSSTDSAADKTSIYTYFDDFQIETFNYATPNNPQLPGGLDQSWTWFGNASIVNGSVGGRYAAPYGTSSADMSNYLSVPNPTKSGSITAILNSTYDYFGLWWGSVDIYNSISFYNNGMLTESFTGSDIKNGNTAYGNQIAPATNLYVNFLDLQEFDSFTLTSTNFAFEVDNIAVGNAPVPEPATMLLFGTGLIGLAGARARRKKK